MAFVAWTNSSPSSIDALSKTVAASGVSGLRITSTYRPGAKTSSGNTSWHARKQAIDVSGSGAAMEAYAKYISSNYGSSALEIIHQGVSGTKYGWHNGQPHTYSQALYNAHKNHVHVAATLASLGGASFTPAFNPLNPLEDVGNAISGSIAAVQAVVDKLKSLAEFTAWITQPNNAKRVVMVMTGGFLIAIGAYMTSVIPIQNEGLKIATKFIGLKSSGKSNSSSGRHSSSTANISEPIQYGRHAIERKG